MNDNPILQFVLDLADEGLHPSCIVVERVEGAWQCRVELDDWCSLGDGDNPARVSVDRTDLPSGVSVHAVERFAPRILPLEMPDRDQITAWIQAVAHAGHAPDYGWIGDHRCLTKPVMWLREPLRSALMQRLA